MRAAQPDRHGSRCSCRQLAEAVGCAPRVVSFNYCRAVVQKHWRVDCDHQCAEPVVGRGSEEKWSDVGPIDDPVKGILVQNL